MIENMKPYVVQHEELKLIGLPCISLKDVGAKYGYAKEGLISSTKHLPHIKNPHIHYGLWPQLKSQQNPELFAYILCVEVQSFDGIPEWYFKTTIPAHRCVVVASNESNPWDAAGPVIDRYVVEQGFEVGKGDFSYTICERYNYEEEGFARYSLPILGEGKPFKASTVRVEPFRLIGLTIEAPDFGRKVRESVKWIRERMKETDTWESSDIHCATVPQSGTPDKPGFHLFVGLRVAPGTPAPDGWSTLEIPAQTYGLTIFSGYLSECDNYYRNLEKNMKALGYEFQKDAIGFERYREESYNWNDDDAYQTIYIYCPL